MWQKYVMKVHIPKKIKKRFCHEPPPWFVMGFQWSTTSFIYQEILLFDGEVRYSPFPTSFVIVYLTA